MQKSSARPRCYSYAPAPGFGNPVAAHLVAALDELSARHFDLIGGATPEVLDFLPPHAPSSIAMITCHLAQGELLWMTRLTQHCAPDNLAAALDRGRHASRSPYSAKALMTLAIRVREEVTRPRLVGLTDIDREVRDGTRVVSARGVLMHLVWHWTYHNGQAGMLTMLAGGDYDWALERRMVGG